MFQTLPEIHRCTTTSLNQNTFSNNSRFVASTKWRVEIDGDFPSSRPGGGRSRGLARVKASCSPARDSLLVGIIVMNRTFSFPFLPGCGRLLVNCFLLSMLLRYRFVVAAIPVRVHRQA